LHVNHSHKKGSFCRGKEIAKERERGREGKRTRRRGREGKRVGMYIHTYLNICAKIYVHTTERGTYIFAHIFRYESTERKRLSHMWYHRKRLSLSVVCTYNHRKRLSHMW